jgi:iron-sulfur cluster assembly accessory protein
VEVGVAGATATTAAAAARAVPRQQHAAREAAWRRARRPPTPTTQRWFSSASADAATTTTTATNTAQAEAAAASTNEENDGITLADSAVARLLELGRRAGGLPLALRVEVEGGGCSGFQYVLRLEEGDSASPQQGDRVFEREGARVLVDEVSLGLLKGAVVEYEDTLMRSAFHVASNPNSEASCGCGSSFAAKGM